MADKKTLKFQMMMSPEEAAELDDWMFANRLRSRAEAIRLLWRIGLGFDQGRTELADKAGELLAMLDNFRAALEVVEPQVHDDRDLASVKALEAATRVAVAGANLTEKVAGTLNTFRTEAKLAKLDSMQADLALALEQLEGRTEDAADAATFDQRIAELPPDQRSTDHLKPKARKKP